MQHINAQICNFITQQLQKFWLHMQKTPLGGGAKDESDLKT